MFKLEDDVYLGRLVDIIDCDGNGTIDFREFVVGLAAFVLSGSFGRVRFAFRLFDLNNDGSFSKRELLTAIRAAESRHEASRDAREKRSANYWGDRAVPDPLVRYKDLIGDLDARPDEMGYEEFTRIVTRHPRVFAPVNQMWHALRQYADPAVKVVMQIRQSGNARFFRGTVLEPGTAEQIFAPPGTSPSARADGADGRAEAGARRKRPPERATPKKSSIRTTRTLGGSRGGRDRADARRKPFAALARRRRVVGETNRRRRSGARLVVRVAGRPRAKTRAPAWEADGALALARRPPRRARRSGWTRISRRAARRGRPRAGNRETRTKTRRATSRCRTSGRRRAGPTRRSRRRRRRCRGSTAARATVVCGRRRRRRRAAARGRLPHVDVAALAKRRFAAQRGRDGALRLKRESDARREQRGGADAASVRTRRRDVRSCTPTPSAARPRRGAAGVPTCASTPTPEETGLMCPGTTKARTSRTRPRRWAAPTRRDGCGDDASLAGGFLARVQRHAATGSPSEASRLGL